MKTSKSDVFDSALSHTRRSDASEKIKKIACPLLDVFACVQVSSPRLYRLKINFLSDSKHLVTETLGNGSGIWIRFVNDNTP